MPSDSSSSSPSSSSKSTSAMFDIRVNVPRDLAAAAREALGRRPAIGAARDDDGTRNADRESDSEFEDETPVTSSHAVTLDGTKIDYEARAGLMHLREEHLDREAEIFHVAYLREGVTDPASRPVVFTFNGGPGSSSVWLHLGCFGPRRVRLDDDGFAPPPPYELVDNDCSILDDADLVFIDPVSTGYSRARPAERDASFHGVKPDVESVAEFIRRWLVRHDRWGSPKYLAGESYGTTRAAALADHLQARHGIYLNGLVLISSVLHFQTLRFGPGNDLAHVVYLPAFTAAAWYHGRLDAARRQRPLAEVLQEAEAFARTDYMTALYDGTRMDPGRRAAVLARTAELTGLSETWLDEHDLRPDVVGFVEELLRDDRRVVGRLDARYVGTDRWASRGDYLHDPSYAAIHGPYTATLNAYLRTELGYRTDRRYEIFTDRITDWAPEQRDRDIEVGDALRRAIDRNPHLRVLVAGGLYDLATPYHATDWTFAHLGLHPSLRDRISIASYEAGPMMYVRRPSHERLRHDVRDFLAGRNADPADT